MNRQLQPVACRRCSRPLRDHLATRAGIGSRCALFEAAEAADSPVEARPAPDARAAAIAAVTACLDEVPAGVLQEIVAPDGDVTTTLVAVLAYFVETAPGGRERLQHVALTLATEAVS